MGNQEFSRDWEEFSKIDPKWSIVSNPEKKYGLWDDVDFFKTGEQEINNFFKELKLLNVSFENDIALDFGCGIGRLSRALSPYFRKVFGVDVSSGMIEMAKKLNNKANIEFLLNNRSDLLIFPDKKFSLIYSSITLQHVPSRKVIKQYIEEFLRVLKPEGILYFQLPQVRGYSLLWNFILKIRSLFFHFLVMIGVSRNFVFKYLHIGPYMKMNYITENEIRAIFNGLAQVIKVNDVGKVTSSYFVKKH